MSIEKFEVGLTVVVVGDGDTGTHPAAENNAAETNAAMIVANRDRTVSRGDGAQRCLFGCVRQPVPVSAGGDASELIDRR